MSTVGSKVPVVLITSVAHGRNAEREVLWYYWWLLLQEHMPFAELERRFLQLSLDDANLRPLSHKILDSPDFAVRLS